MEKRKIGRSPLEVSAVGLGLMSMSGVYGNANDEESISLIHYALDKGINLLDSADMYGWPEYVMQACEASLKRLGIDVIDLYYQHRVDPNTPIEETVGAMKRLVEQGKVRFLGLSE